jgi:hypothetical protein
MSDSYFHANSSSRPGNSRRVLGNLQFVGGMITLRAGRPDDSEDVSVPIRALAQRIARYPRILEVVKELHGYEKKDNGIVLMPKLDADVVAGYVAILKNSMLSYNELITSFLPGTAPAAIAELHYVLLACVYVFALEIGDGDAQDAVIAAFIEASVQQPENRQVYVPIREAINIIYAGTPESDTMRAWLVDAYATRSNANWRPDLPGYPYEFLRMLMREVFMMTPASPANSSYNRDVTYWVIMRRKQERAAALKRDQERAANSGSVPPAVRSPADNNDRRATQM